MLKRNLEHLLTQCKASQVKIARLEDESSIYLYVWTHRGSKENDLSFLVWAAGAPPGGACTVIGSTHSHFSLPSTKRGCSYLIHHAWSITETKRDKFVNLVYLKKKIPNYEGKSINRIR